MAKKVLVLAAHADDEALGCGGTLARHAAKGDYVTAVFLTNGVGARGSATSEDAERRKDAAEAALEILGVSEFSFLDFPDNRMDALPMLEIVQAIEPIVAKDKPDIIYTHHAGDLNIDHRIAQQAILTACRPQPGLQVSEVYSFEVLSSTEWANPADSPFLPNHYVNIGEYLETKLRALAAYALEMRDAPHSRSMEHVETLARHRGNCVGLAAAEAFMTLRTIRL